MMSAIPFCEDNEETLPRIQMRNFIQTYFRKSFKSCEKICLFLTDNADNLLIALHF